MKSFSIPPRSPFGLIQEALWPDEWYILVVGIMLNCTTRKQVENVWPSFVSLCPTPQALLRTEPAKVTDVIKSLGFGQRRTKSLFKMTEAYLCANWEHARELPGVGQYGAASWEIFCKHVLPDVEPKDHALLQYHRWCAQQCKCGA